MNQSRLFKLTRWRLAGLYAGTMGLIFGICGLGFYQAMVGDHRHTLDHGIEETAEALRDRLQPSLQQPGMLSPAAEKLLPTLCQTTPCTGESLFPEGHLLVGMHQEENYYYVRFLSLSGEQIAIAGQAPEGLHQPMNSGEWENLKTRNGSRYRQMTMLLTTADRAAWGYVQVGRSLRELDAHIFWVRVVMLTGLPIAMGLVSAASWWLAGLAMQPVYKAYRQMQQFTADAAHELRTPLAAIQATVESTLAEPELPETGIRSTLQAIDRQNHRLSKLVGDLLLLSRMDLQPPAHQSACCLDDIVADSVEELSPLAIAARLLLIADIQTAESLWVVGNAEQIYHLLTNLITNAIQATPPDGKVIVRLQPETGYALIQVEDTGVGIPPEAQPYLFDRFYRVSPDRSRQRGGAGLGLAIVRAIVQAHQGNIQVQSKLGQGSTFSIRLPLRDSA